jgi:hypothetical protein
VNSMRGVKAIVFVAVFLIGGAAFAANKGSFQLQHPASVAGKQLASGTYTVRWDGSGDQVEVKIYQGKNVVASAPARMVNIQRPGPSDSTVMNTGSDGTYSISQIRFGGKNYALDFTSADASAAAGSSASR